MPRIQRPEKYWTALSGPADAERLLSDHVEAGYTNWSVSRHAQVGDGVVFYATSPISSFIASGIVDSVPKADGKWWFSDISGLSKAANPYHIRSALEQMPGWGWLKSPIGSTQVHSDVLPILLKRIAPRKNNVRPGGGNNRDEVEPRIPNDDEDPPARITYVSKRIVRTTAKGDELKKLYAHACQCCGKSVPVPGKANAYVEVHHLRPLGGAHRGMDNWNNMLVLCPNCHAAFDLVSYAIHPKTRAVQMSGGKTLARSKRIKLREGHSLADDNIVYHWNRFKP